MRGITKHFRAVPACDNVDFEVFTGEIHGLLGQNGAGKSTLMNVLGGVIHPDRGSIELDGEEVVVRDPIRARALGIGMVHQHYSLIPTLTVRENIRISTRGRVKRDVLGKTITETGEKYGLEIPLDKRVQELTVGQQQRVEVVKCLIEQPRLLILDEPTAVLTEQESHALFEMLSKVVGSGVGSVILISHDLAEMRAVAHRATIMRAGRVVCTVEPARTSTAELARRMIGRDLARYSEATAIIGIEQAAPRETGTIEPPPSGPPVSAGDGARSLLDVVRVTANQPDGRRGLDGLELTVAPGEIVGVAGVEGNGQKWLGALLAGQIMLQHGRVLMAGKEIRVNRPGAMRAAGIGVVPEDRRESGCALDMTVAENIAFGSLRSLARRGFVSARKVRALAERLIDEFDISVASLDQPMRTLSGGNQQKIVLARELSASPRVLVLAQPTRGLDIGAVEYIYERVREAAERGVGIVLISTDLTEILRFSDRIVVMYRGKVHGEMLRQAAEPERLGLLMGGVPA